MRYFLISLLILTCGYANAQFNKDQLYGSWVKVKATYANGDEMPDDDLQKYNYAKYMFVHPDIIRVSTIYYEEGGDFKFDVNDSTLEVKLQSGFTINTLKIGKIKDTLTFVQAGPQGFTDPSSVKFYFVPEAVYQNSIKINPDDIQSISAGDTIYKESPKIYADYGAQSFQQDIYKGIDQSMDNRSGHLAAIFTVSKTGMADSVKILEGIDAQFDKKFLKVFNHTKKNWKPATLNGKPVAVEMTVDLRYSTSDQVIPSGNYTDEAKKAYTEKNYAVALYFYDKALSYRPDDKDNLYMRGICKILLGNRSGACEDWLAIKKLGGSPESDAMLAKFCK